jgi:type I restriction enzyme M protein
MLTGEIRSQIDQIWNAFWSGGISNPLEVIEQITYLLFLKRLDEQEIAEELKANREKKPMQKRFFPEGKVLEEGQLAVVAHFDYSGLLRRANISRPCIPA